MISKMKETYTISKITYYPRASSKIIWNLVSKGNFYYYMDLQFIPQNRSKINELLKTIGLRISYLQIDISLD